MFGQCPIKEPQDAQETMPTLQQRSCHAAGPWHGRPRRRRLQLLLQYVRHLPVPQPRVCYAVLQLRCRAQRLAPELLHPYTYQIPMLMNEWKNMAVVAYCRSRRSLSLNC
jgi:hypothetical protein